ncbi:cytochrome b/b6 domain-containing protein [Nibrella viscosa]
MIALPTLKPISTHHATWVKILHWVVTGSFLALAFSGVVILMCHPRLYWGEVGNDLTPALFELPISRNYQHGGWTTSMPFFRQAGSPVSADRTYDIFNQNGWGRSLHFLSAWFLVVAGLVYLLMGIYTGHFRKHLWPQSGELTGAAFWRDVVSHVRMKVPAATHGPQYGLLQKCTYVVVIFFLLPLIVLTGLTMSPAITAAYPFLLKLFLGAQSARTIHFFAFLALMLFLLIHVVMVIRSGFKQQIRSMTLGD